MLNSLSRKRIRASWNKYNLYNLVTWRKTLRRGTLYQQKFTAKQESRSYHGEHLTETQFRNIFRGKLNGVNPLESSKARKDGSDKSNAEIPWAMQTYVALERRLDTALFRCMFASSTRQAAQFIIRGAVQVNGVKIKQPGFALSPGDVLSVNPEYVLTALGRKKPSIQESVTITNRVITRYNNYLARCKKSPEVMWKLRERLKKRHSRNQKAAKEAAKQRAANNRLQKQMNTEIDKVTPATVLETILRNEGYYELNKTLPLKVSLGKSLRVLGLVTGRKVDFNEQPADQKVESTDTQTADKIDAQTNQTVSESDNSAEASAKTEASATEAPAKATTEIAVDESRIKTIKENFLSKNPDGPSNKSDVKKLLAEITKDQQEDIRKSYSLKMKQTEGEAYDPTWVDRLGEPLPLIEAEAALEDINSVLPIRLPFSTGKLYGLADSSKGYFTPWTPRQLLAPFAILPHHLEISFKTCHAIYLRDPVARPGQSELISPFPLDMHERAHMFYDNRKRKF